MESAQDRPPVHKKIHLSSLSRVYYVFHSILYSPKESGHCLVALYVYIFCKKAIFFFCGSCCQNIYIQISNEGVYLVIMILEKGGRGQSCGKHNVNDI